MTTDNFSAEETHQTNLVFYVKMADILNISVVHASIRNGVFPFVSH